MSLRKADIVYLLQDDTVDALKNRITGLDQEPRTQESSKLRSVFRPSSYLPSFLPSLEPLQKKNNKTIVGPLLID
jgi:hypothetical protein